MQTISRDQIAEVLAITAKRAVLAANAAHPVDLANAAVNAVEAAGDTIDLLNEHKFIQVVA